MKITKKKHTSKLD